MFLCKMHIVSPLLLIVLLLVQVHLKPATSYCFQPANVRSKMNSVQRRAVNPRRLLQATAGPEDPSHHETADSDGELPLALPSQPKIFSFAMLALPVTSLLFPQLLELAKSLPANSSEQFAVVTALFASNRIYLYALSATIVALAAIRGSSDSPRLGERIVDLTEELLYRPSLEVKYDSQATAYDDQPMLQIPEEEAKPAMIESLTKSGFGDSLDQVSTETQALFLPILVSLLLATSVFLLPIWNNAPSTIGQQDAFSFLLPFQDALSQVLPKLGQLWNIFLLTMFTRSEIRRLASELDVSQILSPKNENETESSLLSGAVIMEWTVAIGIIVFAFFLQQWPAQNFVNMALAVQVARAIQLNKFPAIVGALSLLTLYDAASVFLIPAANALDATTLDLADAAASSTAAARSAMGSVAIQKLTSDTFSPGLLTTKIGSSLGGTLGLGDAVFPSLLAIFVRRFDLHQVKQFQQDRRSLFSVSIGGYLLGCFACEFAPMISSSGIPALVFIIPAMLGSIFISAINSGELEDLIQFDPTDTQTVDNDTDASIE